MDNIILAGDSYKIVDVREKLTIADSFVVRANKLGSGNGEAKLYVGQRTDSNLQFWGKEPFSCQCFLLKNDLLRYLDQVHAEYLYPEQSYQAKETLPELWQNRRKVVELYPDRIEFSLQSQTQIVGPRLYVSSETRKGSAYNLIRELSLPNVTYVSILKLVDESGRLSYYFRLFASFLGDEIHPAIVEQQEQQVLQLDIPATERQQIVRSRQGQGTYRSRLLEECPFCPVTLVSDDRLLIASHIKPWAVSSDRERLDPKNGLMLTPTIDRLFDQGYLSFTDDKQCILSPFLSPRTFSLLALASGKSYPNLPIEGRQEYMAYHRDNILKH